MASPQKENGYTSISNELFEKIISSGLNGTELSIVLFIIRKTYGFQKKEDQISLSQFTDTIPCTKPSICKALKNLQLVKIIKLVKKGNSKISSNLWSLNKDYDSWQLVKKFKLVKVSQPTSKDSHSQLVKRSLHTKETKEITKERHTIPPTLEMVTSYLLVRNNGIDAQHFIDVNEAKGWMYGKTKMKDWQAVVRTWERQPWNKVSEIPEERDIKKLIIECETKFGKEKGNEIAFFRWDTVCRKKGLDINKYLNFFPSI
jgi:phage replication O-like protein O